MSRFQLLTDAQWSLIEELRQCEPVGGAGLPRRSAGGRRDHLPVSVGDRRRDVPEVFGPWQTIWTWHQRMSAEAPGMRAGSVADHCWDAGVMDWAVAVDSTIARAHQHATNITRDTGGWVELHESGKRAA